MEKVTRAHLAGLLLVDELDGTVAISELIAQASAEPEDYCGITDEHLGRIYRSFALSGADIESLARLESSAAPEQESVTWIDPVALDSAGPVYDAGFRDGCAESKRLNTHAHPSEVERLRAENAAYGAAIEAGLNTVEILEQKLAEAQALLLDSNKALKNVTREYIRTRVQFCGESAEDLEDVVCVQAARKALSATAQPAECCTPTEAELKLIADGDYRAEELWGGPRPTCRKCIGNPAAKQSEEAKNAARYRWLRDEALHVETESPAVVVVDEYGNQSEGVLYGEKLDLAIDAARSSEEVSGHE